MKELSIEEKAKRYDKAIEKAKSKIEDDNFHVLYEDDVIEIFPELAESESEDEKIRKELIKGISKTRSNTPFLDTNITREEALAWLEKQGEQKPADKVEPKFKIEEGKWYICISQFCNCIEGRVYKATSNSRIIDDFGTEYDMHSDAYKYFRLWTIQDAKDGDILATPIDVLIFKNHLPKNGGVSYCHYTSDSTCNQLNYNENNNWYFGEEAIINPATKEQRDLLFQKMKEAGYEWDAEKKELKKIEQKPTEWSERDYWRFARIIRAIKISTDCNCEDEDWLKSLKDRVQSQLRQEWSEKDENTINEIIEDLNSLKQSNPSDISKEVYQEEIDWLKSLKDRVQPKQEWSDEDEEIYRRCICSMRASACGFPEEEKFVEKVDNWLKSLRPQSHWKPSDEQIKALWKLMQYAPNLAVYTKIEKSIESLYINLKKLKKE